jgi:predicted alpha/beta-fold hydrolase
MAIRTSRLLICHEKYIFTPTWWLDNGRLQTVFPILCRQSPQVITRRERIQTPDQDFIDIDIMEKAQGRWR